MDELRNWYQNLTYSEADAILRENLSEIKRSFVTVGYYLKRIRDDKLFREGGYESVWDYAEDRFGVKRTTASRWMSINDKFSVNGNSPNLAERYADFGKGQLQEMLYLEEEQLDEITPDMTVKEIREVRNSNSEPEGEQISVLGYPLRIYQEDSLLATPGCGKQDCYSCHRDGCNLRQEDCYCVEAPIGNPFPCTTLNVVCNLRQDIGNRCQFVNTDLADRRVGDGQPVPCCKRCNNPCGYECNRSVQVRYKTKKAHREEMRDVAQEEVIKEKHGVEIDELNLSVRTYNVLKKAGVGTIEEIQGMSDVDLAMIRNFSKRCMEDLRGKLEEYARNNSEKLVCDVAQDENQDIDNNKDNIVIKHEEYVIEPAGSVIDAVYEETAAENSGICCQKAADLDELTFSEIAIRDYLEEEEQTLAEYEKVNYEDGGLPYNLMMRQRMLVKALRLLMKNKVDQDDQEEDGDPEELEPVQQEFPVLRNNDQRKEWLKNYKEWPVWFEVPEAAEIYYRFDLEDGSSIVICEYHKWLSWKERYTDENPDSVETRKYLLEPGYKFLSDCISSESLLVEYLKNMQKKRK